MVWGMDAPSDRQIGGEWHTWVGTADNGRYVPYSSLSPAEQAKLELGRQYGANIYTAEEKGNLTPEQAADIWGGYDPALQTALMDIPATPAPGGMMSPQDQWNQAIGDQINVPGSAANDRLREILEASQQAGIPQGTTRDELTQEQIDAVTGIDNRNRWNQAIGEQIRQPGTDANERLRQILEASVAAGVPWDTPRDQLTQEQIDRIRFQDKAMTTAQPNQADFFDWQSAASDLLRGTGVSDPQFGMLTGGPAGSYGGGAIWNRLQTAPTGAPARPMPQATPYLSNALRAT